MTSSDLLTVPGRWLADRWVPLEAGASDTEARADLEVTLGLGLWVVSLLLLAVAWRRCGQRLQRSRRQGRASAAASAGMQSLRAAAREWDGPALWAVLWRAQLAHGAVYVVAPGLWELLRVALFVVALPFSIMGFGDKVGQGSSGLEHLVQPACWTFATPCPWPQGDGAVWAKLVWALLAVAWATHWRRTPAAR